MFKRYSNDSQAERNSLFEFRRCKHLFGPRNLSTRKFRVDFPDFNRAQQHFHFFSQSNETRRSKTNSKTGRTTRSNSKTCRFRLATNLSFSPRTERRSMEPIGQHFHRRTKSRLTKRFFFKSSGSKINVKNFLPKSVILLGEDFFSWLKCRIGKEKGEFRLCRRD